MMFGRIKRTGEASGAGPLTSNFPCVPVARLSPIKKDNKEKARIRLILHWPRNVAKLLFSKGCHSSSNAFSAAIELELSIAGSRGGTRSLAAASASSAIRRRTIRAGIPTAVT